ncbi:MAG TPA: hypothetical protein VF063_10690 [Gaiellaceae bacterium]
MGTDVFQTLAEAAGAAEEAAAEEGVDYEAIGGTELDADPLGVPTPPPPDLDEAMPAGGLAAGGPAVPEPAGMIRIDNLLGIPLLYQGDALAPKPTSFRLMPSFKPVLEATVRQVQERAPAEFGSLDQIVSLGMFTAKPGAHGRAVANDWDRLRFTNLEISPRNHEHNSPSLPKRQRYWAFAAICRSNSAFILHGFYNSDHENHIHQDTFGRLAFDTGSEANVKLFQAVLNDIFGTTPKLDVDGDFGEKSRGALAKAQQRLGIAGNVTQDVATMQKFLRASGRLGFQLSVQS